MSAPVVELPRTVKTLTKRLAPGWTHRITTGTGTMSVSYHGTPRGDGTRPLLPRDAPCTSLALRARHLDGRAAVGVWVRVEDKPFKFDAAFRWHVCRDETCPRPGDHPGELPTRLDARALGQWLAASSDLAISTHGPTEVREAA